jgi:xanthine dehydrogenase iron-sulfur cluster and FAD-binding subunit A
MLAVQTHGGCVETVESLGTMEALSPLQQAFREFHALQCGFCTPGMLMTAYHFLATHSNPTRREIREALAGNILPLHGLPVHRQRRRARGKRDGPARRRRQLTCRWTPLQRVASSERLK